jgi:metal-responsive CopG/Arc/MetJ family transcriptional regulator
MKKTKYQTVTLSLPPELAEAVDRVAAEEARTRSELFREMIRVYLERRAARGHVRWDGTGVGGSGSSSSDVSRETPPGDGKP